MRAARLKGLIDIQLNCIGIDPTPVGSVPRSESQCIHKLVTTGNCE